MRSSLTLEFANTSRPFLSAFTNLINKVQKFHQFGYLSFKLKNPTDHNPNHVDHTVISDTRYCVFCLKKPQSCKNNYF